MKIERVINGETVTIELTEHELWDAYREQEREFVMEDVREWHVDEDIDMPENVVSEIATRALNMMNNCDTILQEKWECICEAVKEVIGVE